MQDLLTIEKRILYRKIQKSKKDLTNKKLKKTGYNNFAKYHYFQLEDITPSIVEILQSYDLHAGFSFTDKKGFLTISDCEHGASETWETDLTENLVQTKDGEKPGDMKGIQKLQTYARRALYLQALEVSEPIEIEMDKKRVRSPVS